MHIICRLWSAAGQEVKTARQHLGHLAPCAAHTAIPARAVALSPSAGRPPRRILWRASGAP